MIQGKDRIIGRSPDEDPILMVLQKTELEADQTLQQPFSSEAV